MILRDHQIDDLHQEALLEWEQSPDMLTAINAAYAAHQGFLVDLIKKAPSPLEAEIEIDSEEVLP